MVAVAQEVRPLLRISAWNAAALETVVGGERHVPALA